MPLWYQVASSGLEPTLFETVEHDQKKNSQGFFALKVKPMVTWWSVNWNSGGSDPYRY